MTITHIWWISANIHILYKLINLELFVDLAAILTGQENKEKDVVWEWDEAALSKLVEDTVCIQSTL